MTNTMKETKEDLPKICNTCDHCIYIGEGDYICDANEPIIVMEDHCPNDNFWYCTGCDYEDIEFYGEEE